MPKKVPMAIDEHRVSFTGNVKNALELLNHILHYGMVSESRYPSQDGV